MEELKFFTDKDLKTNPNLKKCTCGKIKPKMQFFKLKNGENVCSSCYMEVTKYNTRRG